MLLLNSSANWFVAWNSLIPLEILKVVKRCHDRKCMEKPHTLDRFLHWVRQVPQILNPTMHVWPRRRHDLCSDTVGGGNIHTAAAPLWLIFHLDLTDRHRFLFFSWLNRILGICHVLSGFAVRSLKKLEVPVWIYLLHVATNLWETSRGFCSDKMSSLMILQIISEADT